MAEQSRVKAIVVLLENGEEHNIIFADDNRAYIRERIEPDAFGSPQFKRTEIWWKEEV